MDEERRVTVLLQPLDHGLAHKARLRELDGKPRRNPGPTVGVGAREPLYRLVQVVGVGRDVEPLRGEPASPRRAPLFPRVFDHGAKSGQHPLVAEQPRVAGRHGARVDRRVRVPEEHRVVARLTSQERHVGEPGVQRCAVQDRAIAVLVRARIEARSRRPARRRVGPMIREEDAATSQGVESGCFEDRMAERRQAVPAPLVERDEEDVAGRRHGTTLADVAHPRARPAGWRGDRTSLGLKTYGSSLLRAWSRTRSTTNRAVGRRPGALLGHRSPGGRGPSAAPPRHHSLLPRHAPFAATSPMSSDPSGGRRPGIALPASGSSVHLARLSLVSNDKSRSTPAYDT
jgi:hypothetical protein